MLKHLTITAAMILVIVAAVFLRVHDLGLRPFHGDEAVNAVKFARLWDEGRYEYDPAEFHGPALPYFTLPVMHALGPETFDEMGEAEFRAVAVIFGVMLVVMTAWLGRAIGWPAALIAAALAAASPAFIYWSRYYIHEMLLVFFTLGAIHAGWQYSRSKWWLHALACGAYFGLMHATKETGALSGVAMLLALIPLLVLNSRRLTGGGLHALLPVRLKHLLLGIAAFAVMISLFFTSFFTHWRGPLDSVLTYFNWFTMGVEGNEARHLHPWYYYFDVLFWHEAGNYVFSELLILVLALIGFAAAIFRFGVQPQHVTMVRFLALYTLILTAIYCVIPYKTPWSMLSFYHGWVLMAGVGAAAMGRVLWTAMASTFVPLKLACRSIAVLSAGLLLASIAHLGWQSYIINTRFHVHRFNPYAYSQPTLDVRRLADRAQQIAAVSEQGRDMPIVVIHGGNYWPLPYYLRAYNVGYFPEIPERIPGADAAMIIADPNLADETDERVTAEYEHEYYGLRRAVPLEVYVRKDLWDEFIRRVRSADQ